MKEILKAKGITKHYNLGKDKKIIHALDNIDIEVFDKEIMGIVGESGSGKSTLGKCIIGLEKADKGEIVFNEKRMEKFSNHEMKSVHQEMQMIFQNPFSSFNPKITIGKSLFRLCKYHKMSMEEAKERIEYLFEVVNLGIELLGRLPRDLSGGQLQRLALVRALIPNPNFLIADEAVSALDISVQAQVLNLFLDFREKMNLSILFISHDLDVVQQICDRVAVLYLGQIVEVGTVSEIYDNTQHPYTESLILSKPKEHPDDEEKVCDFRGDGLNAVDVGTACRFYGRCPYSKEGLCNKCEPVLRKIGENHWVACHREKEEMLNEKIS